MWHALYSHRYPMAVYRPHLRHYLVPVEGRPQDRTADGRVRTASVDGETMVASAEVDGVVEADSTIGG